MRNEYDQSRIRNSHPKLLSTDYNRPDNFDQFNSSAGQHRRCGRLSATGRTFCNFLLISTTQLSLLFIGTLYEIWTAKQKVSLTSTDTITAAVRESICGASTYHLFGDRFIKKNPETHFL